VFAVHLLVAEAGSERLSILKSLLGSFSHFVRIHAGILKKSIS